MQLKRVLHVAEFDDGTIAVQVHHYSEQEVHRVMVPAQPDHSHDSRYLDEPERKTLSGLIDGLEEEDKDCVECAEGKQA